MRQDNILIQIYNEWSELSHSQSLILSYHKYINRTQTIMFPEPRYLQLEEELFPSLTLYKEMLFDDPHTGFHAEIFERVAYDSQERSIDLTECVEQVLKKEYREHAELEILVLDPLLQDYRFLAYFPLDRPLVLRQQFLQLDVLLFRLRPLPPMSDPCPSPSALPETDPSGQLVEAVGGGEEGTCGQERSKRRRSVREVLEVVEKWQQLCVQSNWKMSLQEGASQLGVSKRSLLFYLHNVKLGQKYHFPFQAHLDAKISELTSFVNEKTLQKKHQEAALLSKLKTYYK